MRTARRPTLLLVEDSPDEEMLILRSIRRSGVPCELIVAHTTDEALDYLLARGAFQERPPTNPDVILTDLRVGTAGGAGLIMAVRAHKTARLIPIVVLTGAAQHSEVDALYRLGANSFLEKPTDFDEFSGTVSSLLRYWGQLNIATGKNTKADRSSMIL